MPAGRPWVNCSLVALLCTPATVWKGLRKGWRREGRCLTRPRSNYPNSVWLLQCSVPLFCPNQSIQTAKMEAPEHFFRQVWDFLGAFLAHIKFTPRVPQDCWADVALWMSLAQTSGDHCKASPIAYEIVLCDSWRKGKWQYRSLELEGPPVTPTRFVRYLLVQVLHFALECFASLCKPF